MHIICNNNTYQTCWFICLSNTHFTNYVSTIHILVRTWCIGIVRHIQATK